MLKSIWILWYQGKENMTELVRNCYNSWTLHNPDWDVTLLTEENLPKFLDQRTLAIIDQDRISIQAKSDIIRINILATHGGVWADATCFCCKPLNDWIQGYANSNFFAFSYEPQKPTLLSSWFLVGSPNSLIINKWRNEVNDYWNENPKLISWSSNIFTRYFVTGLKKIFKTAIKGQNWFHFIPLKLFRVYPYFWFHYLFEKCVLTDKKFEEEWLNIPKSSSEIPHKLQHYGFLEKTNLEIINFIKDKKSPVIKLSNAHDYATDGCVAYLFKFYKTDNVQITI